MTCLLNSYGQISKIDEILAHLKEVDNKLVLNEIEYKENWIDSLQLCFSSCGKLVVFASKFGVVICQGRWSMTNQMNFNSIHRFSFEEKEDEITSVCAIPICSKKKSSEGLPEWICIVLGSKNGRIRMYTENGILVATQLYSNNEVLKIKCRTYESPKYIGWIQQPEELEIIYLNNILVCIDGFELFNFLSLARKNAANLPDNSNEMDSNASLTLDYKIWNLGYQEEMVDFCSAGFTNENRFDQLFAASMIGGPSEKFESNPPVSNRYVTCGKHPFISFYYTIEGLSLPVFTEVKQAAGKVTGALFNIAKGWMGFGGNQKSNENLFKPKTKLETPTYLPARFSLNDHRRNGETVIIAPANNLVAMTDSFARVILIDMTKGIAIRVFKGYRDAQIGWICVDDETEDKNNKRYALYLIIYAPRRGLLEIWGCQQGIRVAAFNVGKFSKLICPEYYMLSLNGSLLSDMSKTSKITSFLIDTNGKIKNIQIPFHLILSDKSNQTVRDTILFKKLKSELREKSINDDFLSTLQVILHDIKTPSIKQQALEKIINSGNIGFNKLLDIIKHQFLNIMKQGFEQTKNHLRLAYFCQFHYTIINSFKKLIMYQANLIEPQVESNQETDYETLLKLEKKYLNEYFEIKQFVDEKLNNSAKKAAKNEEINLSKFISNFEFLNDGETKYNCFLETENLRPNLEDLLANSELFNLEQNITNKNKQQLGSFLFSKLLSADLNFEDQLLTDLTSTVPLEKNIMLDILIITWISNSYSNIKCLHKLILLLVGLEKIGECNEEKKEIQETSFITQIDMDDYLKNFQGLCETTSLLNIDSALIIIWIFRSIIIEVNDSSNTDALIKLEEKIFILIRFHNLLLTGNFDVQQSNSINLKYIFTQGKGVLTEILARHIVLNKFPPKLLTFPETDNEDDLENPETNVVLDVQDDLKLLLQNAVYKEFYDTLESTRSSLPRSLEPDILLTNAAWEAAILFDNNIDSIHFLEISLRYCSEIGNSILKQGILNMIWHQYLIKKLSAITNLIEKIGKAPKDRHLKKEIGLNEETLKKFLECVITLLDLIMDANCSINEVPIFMHDHFWDGSTEYLASTSMIGFEKENLDLSITTSKNKQLVEIAAEQKHVNYFLCLFHSQLIRILYLITKYDMKSTRPLSFFDTKGKHALFSELHTHPLLSNDVDIKIMDARKTFFTKAIAAILKDVVFPTSIKSKLPKETDETLLTIFNLCKDMEVDLEYIKGYYCCMLYALDYHLEGEKVLGTIKEMNTVAHQLLVVVGWKINEILQTNFNANLVSILSTNLTSWLKSIGAPEYKVYTLPSKQPILELLDNIIMKISPSFSENKIATELFDFIENPQLEFIFKDNQ